MAAPREITIDLARARQPIDRFFDLSVGSDYPGTLIRSDAQKQLKTAVDELGLIPMRSNDVILSEMNALRR